jgi:CRP-like cAMP-binding protein
MTGREPELPNHGSCERLTGLTIEHVPRDGSIGRMRRFVAGDTLWRPEDRTDRVLFLEQGEAAIIVSDSTGQEFTIRTLGRGEPLGELCFCAGMDQRRRTVCRATAAGSLLEVTRDDFFAYLQSRPDVLTALTYTFCARLHDAEQRLDVLMHRGAERRLGRMLLSLATTQGTRNADGTQAVISIRHDELAALTAMNRSHVTVTLGRLRERGLIAYSRRQPITVNIQLLTAYLQFESTDEVRSSDDA